MQDPEKLQSTAQPPDLQVDIDLSSEGDARKVSRQQAHLSLRPDGRFQLKNVGRRTILVNNRQVIVCQEFSYEQAGLSRPLWLLSAHAPTLPQKSIQESLYPVAINS